MTERIIRIEFFYSPPLTLDAVGHLNSRQLFEDRNKTVPFVHGGVVSRYVTVPSDISVYDFLRRLLLDMMPGRYESHRLILHSVVLYRSHPESGYMIANIKEPLLLKQDDRIETFLIQLNRLYYEASTEIPSELIHIQTYKDVDTLLRRYPDTSSRHPSSRPRPIPRPRVKPPPVQTDMSKFVGSPDDDTPKYEREKEERMLMRGTSLDSLTPTVDEILKFKPSILISVCSQHGIDVKDKKMDELRKEFIHKLNLTFRDVMAFNRETLVLLANLYGIKIGDSFEIRVDIIKKFKLFTSITESEIRPLDDWMISALSLMNGIDIREKTINALRIELIDKLKLTRSSAKKTMSSRVFGERKRRTRQKKSKRKV